MDLDEKELFRAVPENKELGSGATSDNCRTRPLVSFVGVDEGKNHFVLVRQKLSMEMRVLLLSFQLVVGVSANPIMSTENWNLFLSVSFLSLLFYVLANEKDMVQFLLAYGKYMMGITVMGLVIWVPCL